jgi:hypothetical protein
MKERATQKMKEQRGSGEEGKEDNKNGEENPS